MSKEGIKSLSLNCPASGSHGGGWGGSTTLEVGLMWVTEYGTRYAGKQHYFEL